MYRYKTNFRATHDTGTLTCTTTTGTYMYIYPALSLPTAAVTCHEHDHSIFHQSTPNSQLHLTSKDGDS